MQTLSQKLITKHQWLVHMGTVILDTSKTVATEMEIQFLNTLLRPHPKKSFVNLVFFHVITLFRPYEKIEK